MATIHYNAQAISGITAKRVHGMNDYTLCQTASRKGTGSVFAVTADPAQVDCKRCVKSLSSRVVAVDGVKVAETRRIDITPEMVGPNDLPRCAECDYYTDSHGHATSCN